MRRTFTQIFIHPPFHRLQEVISGRNGLNGLSITNEPSKHFMKILIASIPGAGHLNPLLSIASLLVESGYEVAVQVNEELRPAVESAGHHFLSEIPNAQT